MNFRNLTVYKKSYDFVIKIYKLLKSFPKDELFGIVDQIKRASVSIVLNIAEGYSKNMSNKEIVRFLRISKGSAGEVAVLLELSRDLKFIDNETSNRLIKDLDEVERMLYGLIKTLM